MDEAQALADRVVLVAGGVVVAAGPPPAIGGRDAERARITFSLPAGYTIADLPLPASERDGWSGGDRQPYASAAPADRPGRAVRRGALLAGLTVDRPSPEDVYLRLTGDDALSGAPERSTR